MFSVANLLDRAKAGGHIDSDYRLAKVIGISHGTMSGYRANKSMPDERVLEQLCALSGDDLAVMAAQIQSERARTQEGKNMWSMIAKRLAGGANPAILSLAFAIFIVAGYAQPASADDLPTLGIQEAGSLYIVLSTYFVCALLSWSLYQRFKSGSVR